MKNDKANSVVVDGIRFSMDPRSGYFQGHAPKGHSKKTLFLHRYMWERSNGRIPRGYQIHHKDGDRSNNELANLQLMTVKEHQKYHNDHMTDADREMRRKAMAYASTFAKAWHSSEEGRAWHRYHVAESIGHVRRTNKTCDACGKEFMGIATQRFCSNACKSRWRRANGVDNIKKTCPICGREFYSNKFSQSETCSRSCANKLWWSKKAVR